MARRYCVQILTNNMGHGMRGRFSENNVLKKGMMADMEIKLNPWHCTPKDIP
jgi:hypothetical protein